MSGDLVMRSVYMPAADDMMLRELAHRLTVHGAKQGANRTVTKSELLRAAVHRKLAQWLLSNDPDTILRDIDLDLEAPELQAAAPLLLTAEGAQRRKADEKADERVAAAG